MTLSYNSRIVRWAYFFNSYVPSQTSLCKLFWKTVLITPLIGLGIGGVCGFLLWLITYVGLYKNTKFTLVSIAFIGALILYVNFANKKVKRAIEDTCESIGIKVQESILWQGMKAVKGKFCPIIQIR
jgi:hypothetical protein